MKALKNYLDKVKPHFEPGGKLEKFWSVYDGIETLLFVPNTTAPKVGVQIHDSVDSKRVMSIVVMALIPALLLGMYNVGFQHYQAIGQEAGFWAMFLFGLLAVLPKIVVSYGVGLGIEFAVAQVKRHEIQEGFLVSGMLIPMIVPVDTPLWMIAVATAFSVIFVKEIFGGTGMNVFNVALITRAFLFFAYPAYMSGDSVFVRTDATFGLGGGTVVEGFSGATPLSYAASNVPVLNTIGETVTWFDGFIGLVPGSIGETSTLGILLGAILLLVTKVASWRIMLSTVAGGAIMAWIVNAAGASSISAAEQLCYGGFAFAAVFMATDPVTACRTNTGKYIYGAMIGVLTIIIRVFNTGYPEGAMLAVLLMNVFAPLIDFYVVEANVKRRLKRANA